MPNDKIIFIITAAAIALLLFHKGSDGFPDNSTARESSVDITTSDETLTVAGDMSEDAQGVRRAPEDAGAALPLTPFPELIEVEQEDLYRPALDVPVGEEGPEGSNGVRLEEANSIDSASLAGSDGDKRLTNTSGMVFVQEGCFVMGNPMDDSFEDEVPAHKVCLGSFFLDAREVRQEAFSEVMGLLKNPARFQATGLPVESVSWYEAARYCSLAGKRLPTEAEWEYAARAEGVGLTWAGTGSLEDLRAFAWMKPNASGRTHEPGALKPNAIGLYDMSGNVREWVADWFAEDYYSDSAFNDPQGPASGSDKVLRGGSWDDLPRYIRVTYRVRLSPVFKNSRNGFRCALSPEAFN